jgi:uncharacterized protein with HEPN domain
VLGEAAAQLEPEGKEQLPEIPWAQPSRLRNRVVHGYGRSTSRSHTTATDLLPSFVERLRRALAVLEADG